MSNAHKGFTLIEVMITVAIIGILAAIAYPSYQQHVLRTHRTAAQACLVELAQWMERYYSARMSYVGAVLPSTSCQTDLSSRYTFSLDGTPTATAFKLRAVPIGAQVADTCGTVTLDQLDRREAAQPNCWR